MARDLCSLDIHVEAMHLEDFSQPCELCHEDLQHSMQREAPAGISHATAKGAWCLAVHSPQQNLHHCMLYKASLYVTYSTTVCHV